jgi:hypothetical protein
MRFIAEINTPGLCCILNKQKESQENVNNIHFLIFRVKHFFDRSLFKVNFRPDRRSKQLESRFATSTTSADKRRVDRTGINDGPAQRHQAIFRQDEPNRHDWIIGTE